MLKSLTIALSISVFTSYGTKDLVVTAYKDNFVVDNLRKQLMQENYDYTLESNETQTVNMRADIKLHQNKSKDEFSKIFFLNYTSEKKEVEVGSQSKHGTAKFDYFTISNGLDESQMSLDKGVNEVHKSALEHPISMKDLLYYMDEEKLLKDKLGPETREMNARRSMDKATDKKYKLLKLRRQHRRKNPVRFIQEEGNNGVVIINLDNGTFPEFRLPRSRRQYMHNHGEVVSEEEDIPPPPVSS